jgi:hypothetical protein
MRRTNGSGGGATVSAVSTSLLPALLQHHTMRAAGGAVATGAAAAAAAGERRQQQRRRVSAFRHHFSGAHPRSSSRALSMPTSIAEWVHNTAVPTAVGRGGATTGSVLIQRLTTSLATDDTGSAESVSDQMSQLVSSTRSRWKRSQSLSPTKRRRRRRSGGEGEVGGQSEEDVTRQQPLDSGRPRTPDGYDSQLWHQLPSDVASYVSGRGDRVAMTGSLGPIDGRPREGDQLRSTMTRGQVPSSPGANDDVLWDGRSAPLESAHEFRDTLSRLSRVQKKQKAQAAREAAEYHMVVSHSGLPPRSGSGTVATATALPSSATWQSLERAGQNHQAEMKLACRQLADYQQRIDARGEESFNWLVSRQVWHVAAPAPARPPTQHLAACGG